jgi:protein phosphatase
VTVAIPKSALVLLVGPAGSGKSTFAKKHFRPTEVISSDFCRAMVSDDESDQSVSRDAFEVLHLIAAKRLKNRRLTVIDATNVQRRARKSLLALAGAHRVPAVAVVFLLPESLCIERDRKRRSRRVGATVIKKQSADLRKSLARLDSEGFAQVQLLTSSEDVDRVKFRRRAAQA